MTARRFQVAKAVADAVTALPQVAGVTGAGGHGVEVATITPQGKVVGVHSGPDMVRVHVIAARLPLPPVIEAVTRAARKALRDNGDNRDAEVFVADVTAEAFEALTRGRPKEADLVARR